MYTHHVKPILKNIDEFNILGERSTRIQELEYLYIGLETAY